MTSPITPAPTPLPVPPDATADARNRAIRTLVQGLGVDVAVAVATVIVGDLTSPSFVFSRAHWLLLGGLLVKTGLMTAASYIARHVKPPAF